jgi:hypothetical protein
VTSPSHDLPRNIGRPATGALLAAGYDRLQALAGVPAADLAKLHGVGPTAIERLQEALAAQGLSLG